MAEVAERLGARGVRDLLGDVTEGHHRAVGLEHVRVVQVRQVLRHRRRVRVLVLLKVVLQPLGSSFFTAICARNRVRSFIHL